MCGVKISLSDWSSGLWSHCSSSNVLIDSMSSWTFVIVGEWWGGSTLDGRRVVDDVSCVGGVFDRLVYRLTKWTGVPGLPDSYCVVLYCQKLYCSTVWLSVVCTVYNWWWKVQFCRIAWVVSAVVSNIASVGLHLEIANASVLFESFVNGCLKHLCCERSLHLLANTVGKTRLITSIVHVYSVWQSKGTFTQSHWTWSLHACCAVPHIMSFHVASSHICRNTPQYDACPIPYHRLRRPLRLIPSQNARQHVVRVHAAPQQTVSVVKVQFVLNSSDRQDVVSCQN